MHNLFSIQTVAIFVVIALPGIIGQVAYALTISRPLDALQNQFVSIFAFGCLNFIIVVWFLLTFVGYPFDPLAFGPVAAIISVVCLIISPAGFDFLLARSLQVLSNVGLISQGSEDEWGAAINWARKQSGEVYFEVHTRDGWRYVGRFDSDAYAGVGKNGGGLFFAIAWQEQLDDGAMRLDVKKPPRAIYIEASRVHRVSARVVSENV